MSKKRSMSIVLPLPTSPYMYSPLGRLSGMFGRVKSGLGEEKRDVKMDFRLGFRSSMEGLMTGGGR